MNQFFFWVLQARLNWLFIFPRIIQTNHPQCDLFHECFIQTVSAWIIISVAFTLLWLSLLNFPYEFISLCRWKYLFGYFTESVESYIWCGSYTHIYTGMAEIMLSLDDIVISLFYVTSDTLIYASYVPEFVFLKVHALKHSWCRVGRDYNDKHQVMAPWLKFEEYWSWN